MSDRVLPAEWIDRLFGRFSATFGAQKLGAMFPAETHDDVRALWAEQLGRFEVPTLRAAMQAVIDSGREWPPTLSEFVAMCQRAAVERRQHAPAALLPMPRSSPGAAGRFVAEAVESIKSRGPNRAWAGKIIARHKAGEAVPMAVLAMARAAQNETPAR